MKKVKNILVVFGHTSNKSLCYSFFEQYVAGLKTTYNKVENLILNEFNFEQYLKNSHNQPIKLDKDLLNIQQKIQWADHLVFIYPTWWAICPALLKVFFEVIFAKGFAYEYKKSIGFIPQWNKLLKNKTASIIVTMDSPRWYYKYVAKDPGYKMMKDILSFCGIKIVNRYYFGSVKMASKQKKIKWIQQVYNIGVKE